MTSQTHGIQQLLTAEKRAAEKVAEARKRKARRLKQAKEEAQAEIEKFRTEKEKQFREYESAHMGSRENIASKIEEDTKMKIETMSRNVGLHKDAVIQQMLALVCDVRPQLHKNLRLED